MEPTREYRPVTRLGLWFKGSWPVAERERIRPGSAHRGPAEFGLDFDEDAGADRSPALARVLDLVGLAERSGFDSVWVSDQGPSAPPGPSALVVEAYSLLGAMATRTTRARLGVVPLRRDRRAPSIVAKMVTGIDVISHGRSILTYGLGADDPRRGAQLVEALRIGRALLEDEVPTVAGVSYAVVGARNRPGPVQVGGVPVVVSVDRVEDLATVSVTEFAGLADAVIVPGRPDEVVRMLDRVRSRPGSPGSDRESDVAPLQVIGIGPQRALPATSGQHGYGGAGPSIGQVAAGVGELFDAGVDGCLVPVDVTTSPEDLADLVTGLRGVGIIE